MKIWLNKCYNEVYKGSFFYWKWMEQKYILSDKKRKKNFYIKRKVKEKKTTSSCY